MSFFLLFQILLALCESREPSAEWQPLNGCIQRLKKFEQDVVESIPLKTIVPLDRRLDSMIEGIRYAEVNSEKLKDFVGSERSDKLAPYLMANATVACEKEEARLTSYLGGLKRFLILFFVTTVSLSIYGSYLMTQLVRSTKQVR